MRTDVVKPKRKSNNPDGRPPLNPSGIIDNVDMLNLKEKGTQFGKSVKLRESTFFILHEMKQNDKDLKSIDDVILSLIQIARAVAYSQQES